MLTSLSLLLALTVSVSNPLDVSRSAVPVVVPLSGGAQNARSASFKGHPSMAYQLDDLDGDGRADELVFLTDMRPSETVDYRIELSEEPETRTFAPETHAYLRLNDKNKRHPRISAISFPGSVPSRHSYDAIYGHGAVLEGLYSAIRVYMDHRQSVDLYAKNTPRLELDTTGFYTTREQLERGFGRDVLWAGTSVALGSFRGYVDGAPVTIDSVITRSQRVVADGPVRSIIEMSDRGWRYGGAEVEMTQRYTVYGRHRDIDVEISLSGAAADALYCTGVQKLAEDNEGFITPDGLAGSWGWNVPDKGMKEIADTVGLGIFIPKVYLVSSSEDDVNYLSVLRADREGKIRYSFASGAVRDSASPRSAAEWFAWLRDWERLRLHPVTVKVK